MSKNEAWETPPPPPCGNLILSGEGEMDGFFKSSVLGLLHKGKGVEPLPYPGYKHLGWIKDLCRKVKPIKLLEDLIEEYFYDFGEWGEGFCKQDSGNH